MPSGFFHKVSSFPGSTCNKDLLPRGEVTIHSMNLSGKQPRRLFLCLLFRLSAWYLLDACQEIALVVLEGFSDNERLVLAI